MNTFLDTSDPELDSRFVLPNIRGQLETFTLADLQPGVADAGAKLRQHVESVCELTQMLLSKFSFDKSWHKCSELLFRDLDSKWTAVSRNGSYSQTEKLSIAAEMLRGQLIACAWSANSREVKPEMKSKVVHLMNLVQMTWDALHVDVARDALKEQGIDQLLLQLLQMHGSSNLIKLYRDICEETDWSEISRVVTLWKTTADNRAALQQNARPASKTVAKPQEANNKMVAETAKPGNSENLRLATPVSAKQMDIEPVVPKNNRFPFGQSQEILNRPITLEKVTMASKIPVPKEENDQIYDRRDELMNILKQNQEKENKQRLNKQVVSLKAAKTQELEGKTAQLFKASGPREPVPLSRSNSFAQPALQRTRSLKPSVSTLIVRGKKTDLKKNGGDTDTSRNRHTESPFEDLFESSGIFDGTYDTDCSMPLPVAPDTNNTDGFGGPVVASQPEAIRMSDQSMKFESLPNAANRGTLQEDQVIMVPPRKRRMSSISRDHWGDDIVALGTPKNEKSSVQVSAAKSSQRVRTNELPVPLDQPLITKRVLNFDL